MGADLVTWWGGRAGMHALASAHVGVRADVEAGGKEYRGLEQEYRWGWSRSTGGHTSTRWPGTQVRSAEICITDTERGPSVFGWKAGNASRYVRRPNASLYA